MYILCDDLGYGDVRRLNPRGKIATPNIDRIAAGGMVFTDAHSSSAVCTPTRYGILTGRYNWRTRLQSGVLGGYSPHLIEDGRLTVASLLKRQGYLTACIGKWHLGMDLPRKPGTRQPSDDIGYDGWNIAYDQPIARGPNTVGFDYYFGISASLDMPPFVFIENDRFTKAPTVEKTFVRKGPAAADFEAMNVLPTLIDKAVDYLNARAPDAHLGHPFFLYMALSAPHGPIVPTPQWQGRSGINPYADFVMETDAMIGRVLDTLDKSKLADDTLLIFASDNGCAPVADFPTLLAHGHDPSYVFRGMKSDIWDGGHHIPFMVRWPAGHVKAGVTSNQLICLNDFIATVADVLGHALPPDAGEDSVSILPALLGADGGPLHEAVIHHSVTGQFAIRQGNWKLELCPGSGGWSHPDDPQARAARLPPVQLYDMTGDVGETRNLQSTDGQTVQRLMRLLDRYVSEGRSTPGAKSHNDVPVKVWKQPGPRPDGD